MAITFDAVNKRIILDSTYVEVGDIYSRWKEWAKEGDHLKWLPAFSVVGGDPLGGGLFVASYFFLQNGWRIRPMEMSQTLEIKGNISVAEGGVPVVPTLGNYNVSVQFTVPVAAQGIDTGGGSGGPNYTLAQIAAAVRSELNPELQKIRDITITDGKVEATCDGGGGLPGAPLLIWNGSAWVTPEEME